MEIFKVCSCDRKSRKIFYGAEDVKDLMRKALAKLGLTGLGLLVTAEDGYEVKEDAPAASFRGVELVALRPGEEWQHAASISSTPSHEVAGQLIMPVLTTSMPDDDGQGDDQVQLQLPAQADETCGKDTPSQMQEKPPVQASAVAGDVSDQSASKLERTPLPVFTGIVKEALDREDPTTVWNKLILQTAQHYFHLLDNPTAHHYKIIGEKMYRQYPCIAMPSTSNPWMAFNKTLAQKVRHIKHELKRKSKKTGQTPSKENHQYRVGPPAKKKKSCASAQALQPVENQQEEDTSSHLQALQDEWRKVPGSRNTGHIQMLLKHTNAYRQEVLRNHPSGGIEPVLEYFPCLSEIQFVMYDFGLKVGPERHTHMLPRIKHLREVAVKSMKDADAEACVDELTSWTRITSLVQFAKGKSSLRANVIKTVEGELLQRTLQGSETLGPYLVIKTKDGIVDGSIIVVGKVLFQLNTKSVDHALMNLIALYYCFDLDYPRAYSQLLGLIQHFVMGEPLRTTTSQGFKFFVKKVEAAFKM